jgi:hypothetical protein
VLWLCSSRQTSSTSITTRTTQRSLLDRLLMTARLRVASSEVAS